MVGIPSPTKHKFWWRSVKGFRGGGGQILPFAIDFDRRPYNSLALLRECVITMSTQGVDVKIRFASISRYGCAQREKSFPVL